MLRSGQETRIHVLLYWLITLLKFGAVYKVCRHQHVQPIVPYLVRAAASLLGLHPPQTHHLLFLRFYL